MNYLFHQEVIIPVQNVGLKGELIIPEEAKAVVIFSHGSGSSRKSARNQQVAEYLRQRNFGTLLFDLLTEEEDRYYPNRFDIELLTKRLVGATEWLGAQGKISHFQLGYFGASTGAASALKAAVSMTKIGAIVSRGGRPDLAMEILQKVKAPTLLIVGGRDFDVLKLNQQVYFQLACEKNLQIVEEATHLFEEPGTMEVVCELATRWFVKHLHPVKA